MHPDPARVGCPLPDADDDGVFDVDDVCPTTAAGPNPDPGRLGCPDGDDDIDSVLNAADACRNEHAGFHPDPARPGCPMADGDHDMIPDAEDACPTEPGAPSSNARRHGCPGLVTLHIDRISIERPVYFATGGDTIAPRSRALLTALAEAMTLTPAIRRISIEGHTDSVGTDEANLDLSSRRAASVMAWLVAHGVEASRLEAHGFGESRPIAEGTSRAVREENRRVEFRVIDPVPTPAIAEGDPR
jgi:outer membrane protein OmpA-like peptidoglycan-associated protein